jgi:hypothetical protein
MVSKLLTVVTVMLLALAVFQGGGRVFADGIGDPKCTGNRC